MENDITEETEEKETMTAQEAEEFLNEMRKVFSIVRILDQKILNGMKIISMSMERFPASVMNSGKRTVSVKTVSP